MKQLLSENWHEVAAPTYLCLLPISVLELEKKYRLLFDEVIEEGIGTSFFAFIDVLGTQFMLKGHVSKSNQDIGVSVYILSFQKNPILCLKKLLNELEMEHSSLLSINEALSEPCWSVYRIDDNNNKIEMMRFIEEHNANFYYKKFELKKHKQKYFVEKIFITP